VSVGIPPVAPSLVLSLIIGSLHTCIYVVIRGHLRLHLLLVWPAAIVGAWAGQAIGARVGDPFRLGDYPLIWASALAWVGILVVSVAATLSTRSPRVGPTPGTAMATPIERAPRGSEED
jgi:hypothetical protein